MDITNNQVIVIALVVAFGFGLIYMGYSSDNIVQMFSGLGSLIVGILAVFTDKPKIGQ